MAQHNGKYHIGEVSKALHIPVETLRFYEQKGLVKPEKDPESKYRSYHYRDVDLLTDCRRLRGAQFSLGEVAEMLLECDLEQNIDKTRQQAKKCAKMAQYYTALQQRLSQTAAMQQEIFEMVGTCRVETQPGYACFVQRVDEYFIGDPQVEQANAAWAEYAAFMDNMLLWDPVMESPLEKAPHPWGYCIAQPFVAQMQIPCPEPVKFVSPCTAVYTVLEKHGQQPFDAVDLKPAFTWLQTQGLQYAGGARGIMLARCKAGKQDFVRYMGVWLPVQQP